jgi:hypothetical protein
MRNHLPVLAAAAAVLVVGWLAYFLLFDRSGAPAIVVLEASGGVTRANPSAGAAPLAAGDELLVRDRIQVGADGGALLGVGAETRLRLEPDSVIEVLSVDEDGVRVELEDGRVQARVRPGSPQLAVSSQGRLLRAADADFTVGADREAEVLAVAVERGQVGVEGAPGGTQALEAGSTATLMPGALPILQQSDAALLLDVRWPTAQTRAATITLEGRTAPRARVRVTGGAAPAEGLADAEGRFTVGVPLREGDNALEVTARDSLGRDVAVDGRAHRDTRAPAARSVDVSWGG